MANDPYNSGVPSVTPDVHMPDDYQHIDARPEAFGALIGQGLQQFGQGAVKATQFYSQVNAQDVTNRAQHALDGLLHGTPGQMVKQPDGTMAPDTGFLGKRGADAANAYGDFQKMSQKIIDDHRAAVQTPEGQQEYDRWSQNYRSYLMRASGQHYETQFNTYTHSVNDAQAQQTLTGIANNAYSDQEFSSRLGDLKGAYIKKSQLDGLGPDGAKAAEQKAIQEGWKARLETISVQHPDQAVALVEQHQKELGQLYEPMAQQFRTRADAASGMIAAKEEIAKAAAGFQRPKQATAFGVGAPAPNGPSNGVGLGKINITYNGPLNSSQPGRPSPADLFAQYKSLGASTNEALVLTSAAASESGLNPGVTHDGGIGYGLFGHNGDRLSAMRAQTGSFTPNWQQQAKFSLNELRSRPESSAVNEAKTPEDLARAQMAYEAPQGYTANSPESGHNYTGRLNTIRRFSQLTGGEFNGGNATSSMQASVPYPASFSQASPRISLPIGSSQSQLPPVDPYVAPPPVAPPSPAPAPAEPPTPEQIKASAYQAIRERDDLTDAQKQHAYSAINQQITEQQIMEQATAKAKKDRSEKASDTYIKQFLSGNVAPDIMQRITNDPNLEPATRLHLGGIAEKYTTNGQAEINSYGKGFWDVVKGASAPPGDPGRITDVDQILRRAMPGGDLTLAGAEKAISIVKQSAKDVDQAHLNASLTSVIGGFKKRLSFDDEQLYPGMPPIKYPEGEFAFHSQFVPRILGEYDKWVADGKNPWDFIKDTKHFAEVAEQILPAKKVAMDKLAAGAALAGEAPPGNSTQKPAIPPPPQNVDPGNWQQVMDERPSTASGKKWDAGRWATYLDAVKTNPTKENLEEFKAKTGLDPESVFKKIEPDNRSLFEKARDAGRSIGHVLKGD